VQVLSAHNHAAWNASTEVHSGYLEVIATRG
jgi:hypothetical protein